MSMNGVPVIVPMLSSPLAWVVLAGLCVGAAASRATMRTRNKPNPDSARTRKWVFACILLSLAVIFGLLAVFIPGAQRIRDPRMLWAGLAAALVAFAAMRFKKALGIPIGVLLLALIIVFGLFLQSIRAFTGETEIAAVKVLSTTPSSMRLELVPRGDEPVLLTMNGTYFAPIVKVVIFSDLFVFMGARTWYRFEGVTSFNDAYRQQDTDFRFARPLGISEKLWSLFEANETRVPGVKAVQIEMTLKKAREFASYGIMVQNDGGVQIVSRSD
jgi:hypothetical protein